MSILDTAGRTIYQLGFQISPIIFTGGIAEQAWGYLPIIAITETGYDFGGNGSAISAGLAAATGLRSLASMQSLDDFFAHFTPVAGGKLANYAIGQYPFANQSVAANAIIAEPLSVSIRMSIPVNKAGGHTKKLVVMMALQSSIKKHASLGGTYTIATPGFLYTNCILTGLTDTSTSGSPIPQNTWQFDFVKPLVTAEEAEAAQSSLIDKISKGLETTGSWAADSVSSVLPSVNAGSVPTGINPTAIGGAP